MSPPEVGAPPEADSFLQSLKTFKRVDQDLVITTLKFIQWYSFLPLSMKKTNFDLKYDGSGVMIKMGYDKGS